MAGGKLTGYRKMAKRVVNSIARKLKNKVKCKTLKIKLTGNTFNSAREVQDYIQLIEKKLEEFSLPPFYSPYLVHNYGIQAEEIIKKLNKSDDPTKSLLMAELNFSYNHEMICLPLDFLERRTGRLYFLIDTVRQYYLEVLLFFKKKMGWDDIQFEKEKEKVEMVIQNSNNFK